MNWIETPYGDIPHKFSTMARTKNTPARRTPSAKYTFGRRIPTSTTARRALNFAGGSPYPMIGRSTPRRKTAKSRIGFAPGTGTSYSNNVVNKWIDPNVVIPSKTLLSENLLAIARQTAGNEINFRERDMINCLGFQMRFCLRNGLLTDALTIRMALVSPTDKNEINTVEFLRGYGDRRTVDLTSTEDSSVLLFNPINRDNYVVLWEKKITLGARSENATTVCFDRSRPNYLSFSTYVPLNRQIRYDGPSANQCSESVFLVMWYDTPNGVGTALPTSSLEYKRYCVTYWKNPGQL